MNDFNWAFWEIAANNPAVHLLVKAWRAGEIRTFEEMLVRCVVVLAEQNSKLISNAVNKDMLSQKSFIVPGGFDK